MVGPDSGRRPARGVGRVPAHRAEGGGAGGVPAGGHAAGDAARRRPRPLDDAARRRVRPWAPAAPEATGHGPGAGTDGSGAPAESYGTGPGDAYPAAPEGPEGPGERLGSGAGDGATAHDAGHTPAAGVPAAAFAPREPEAPEASEVPEAHAPDAAAYPVAAGHPEPADGAPAAPRDPAQAPDPAHAPDARDAAHGPESGHAPDAQAPTHAPDAPRAEPAADGDGDAPAGDAAPVPEAGPSAGAPDEGADTDGTGQDADGVPAASDEHPATSYVLRVNGTDRPVTDAWIGESLLYVLRERLGLAGAKDGCSQGECGACNVQVDGRLVASCLVPAATTAGSEVRTVEGLATDGEPSDVQRALAGCGAVQCGFCIPGMAMTVHDLLEGNHAPTELETRQALCGNLCRCSGYQGVLAAVREVAAGRAERAAAAAAGTAPDGGSAEPGRDEARIPHQAPPGAGSVQAHPHDGGMA
uniref:2Fe-2S iron-sulfur cluster-binding protein n=1 Tax=Streptomyces zhihengii TaxID=1818004 RepID=UPI0035572A3B